jgi:hypothetical protein
MIDLLQLAQAIGSVATAILVLITWQQVRQLKEQVRLSREQATTSIEDHLTQQYREVMRDIPIDIWLGSELKELAPNPERQNQCRDAIYRYIDLSQEQAFLHRRKRVTQETWIEWRSGIRSNMELPAFQEVWAQIEKKWPQSFVELKEVLA